MILGCPNILIIRSDTMGNNVKAIENELRQKAAKEICCREWHSSIVLEGETESWAEVIKAGKLAAGRGYKGVVNRLQVKGLIIPEVKKPLICDNKLEGKTPDVMVIGAGVIGSAISRELSKWNISVLLIDKEDDVAMHSSSRNDGMVHPGIEPKSGSKRAAFNVRGNYLYDRITRELDVHFKRCGSSVMFDKKWIKIAVPLVKAKAKKVGVPGFELLDRDRLLKIEPNIPDDIVCAGHFASTGILSPYKLTIAYAENAVQNGVEISLNTIAESISKENNKIISVTTNRGTVYPKTVIDAAGVYSDHIADMAGDQFFTIHPRKGQIIFLDKKKSKLLHGVVAKPSLALAKSNTKGGGLVRTIDNNILAGPDAYEQPYKEDYSTDKNNIDNIIRKQLPLIKGLCPSDIITYCAGTRAATYEEDFIIEKSEYIENLVYAAGIQSPGLASAPAIAEEIEKITCEVLSQYMDVKKKEKWNPVRKSIPDLSHMNFEERSRLIRKRPDYGIIICRCEEISKGEIVDAIKSPVPVNTIDGIKRRVRAGMGRCQGGFCMPAVMDIIREETNLDMTEITKKGRHSNIVVGENKNTSEVKI